MRRSVPSDGAPRSSRGLPPQTVPSPSSQAPLLSRRVFPHGFLVPLPGDAFSRFPWHHPKASAPCSPPGLPDSLSPAPACPPPAPSPAAASPSARWAPGTGRSPPSWCRRASGPGAGRGYGRRRDLAGRWPPGAGWVVQPRPPQTSRAGRRPSGSTGGRGRDARWWAEAGVAPWACLALPRLSLASPPPPPPPPVSSSATAVTRQLHFRVRDTACTYIIHEEAGPGRPSPAHTREWQTRAAAGGTVLRGRGSVEPEAPRTPRPASSSSRAGASEAPAPWLPVGCWVTASRRSRVHPEKARGPTTTAVPKKPQRLGIEVKGIRIFCP